MKHMRWTQWFAIFVAVVAGVFALVGGDRRDRRPCR